MAEKITLDPFSIWKSVYDQTEKNMNEVIHETLKTEAFSEWLGQVQNTYLQYQQLVQKSTEEYLKQVNMPSREEVASLANLIINIEEKIENIDQKIDDELIDSPMNAEINKLKASVSKLDRKLDAVVSLLEKIQQKPLPSTTVVEDKK